MFAFDRSALAVLLPLAMLVAVAVYSNRTPANPTSQGQSAPEHADQVAANLPSR
jgi:hypothetical protein